MEVKISEPLLDDVPPPSQWLCSHSFPEWFQRLSQCFVENLRSETMTDVVLQCHNGQVRAHKAILALASPILNRTMASLPQDEDLDIIIPDYPVEMVSTLLECLYAGTIPSDATTSRVCSNLSDLLGFTGTRLDRSEMRDELDDSLFEMIQTDGGDLLLLPQAMDVNQEHDSWNSTRELTQMQKSVCQICNSSVINHRVRKPGPHSSNGPTYECCLAACQRKFHQTAKSFVDHVGQHLERSNASPTSDQCPICFKTRIEHKNRNAEDLRSKNAKKGSWYKCCQCSASRLSAKNFRDHVSNHVSKRFKCHICTKGYAHQHLLDEHLRVKHSQLTADHEKVDLHCPKPDCHFQTDYRPTLRSHQRLAHAQPRPPRASLNTERVTCPNCHKVLKKWYYHQYHKKTCSFGDVVYQCDVCHQDGFASKDTLENHIRALHTDERPFACEYCPKRYATQMSLSGHRARIHNMNKSGEFVPKKMFPCDICGKLLTSRTKLLHHVKIIHENEKAYTCSFCAKRFSSKSNKIVHEGAVHTKTYPYACQICAKGFTKKKNLVVHMAEHGLVDDLAPIEGNQIKSVNVHSRNEDVSTISSSPAFFVVSDPNNVKQ
ncbi:hypothetical protein TCAL_07442 [Tigriopus californicus]|uniref:BTB domain-containing protein n=1 Tax=Tigriopus californicus TaxID=6832 RepID=A0A553N8B4_TIGCA|nr:zinc finger protein 197-like [Tigriopus californicus]TRY61650.1 hypothetical protein TCAL_07442 [Tigriopus californicus]